MRLRLLIAGLFVMCGCALAQSNFQPGAQLNVFSLPSDPSPCNSGQIWYNTTSNQYKICPSGSAAVIGTGSGSGTVTSVGFNVNGATSVCGAISLSGTNPVTGSGTINFVWTGVSGDVVTFNGSNCPQDSGQLLSELETIAAAQAAFSGIGACTNQVVTATNANAAPSCSAVSNAALANPSTTVNSQTCTLGGTCTVTVAISSGVSGLATGVATFLGTPTSANLATAVTDETGTGALVFANTPVFPATISVGTTGTAAGTILYFGLTSGSLSTGCVGSTCTAFGNTGAAAAFGKYQTGSNCSSSASPAVCGSAAAGSVALPTGTNPTLVVNTSAVTANSQIMLTVDESLGTKLGVTCNTTLSTLLNPVVTARSANTSFTFTIGAIIATNPACVSYIIEN